MCFDCHVGRVSWTYLMSGMETGMRALPHANETYFRVNEEGILCIQHQVSYACACASFVCVYMFVQQYVPCLTGVTGEL